MNRVCLLPLLLVMACAHVGGEGAGATPAGNRDAAQRLYTVAEERYAAGAYADAVALMRHALLQLPPTPEHDRLRHQLVLRMAHTQLRAHAAAGDVAQLRDAQQMLTRYVERHEQLFGDGAVARSERGEAYELLHVVEKQLDAEAYGGSPEQAATIASTSADAAAGADAPTAVETADALETAEALETAAETAPAVPDEPTAETMPEAPAEAPPIPARRRSDGKGGEIRDVVVLKERRLASLDDPRVMERLRSPFSTGWQGGVLTAGGITQMRGPRALVRGHSRLAGGGDLAQRQLARRAGQSLLREARPQLRECYASAYARRPIDFLDSAVEASIHPDGSVSHVRIVEGGLVDGYGDACVIEALQATTVPPLEEVTEPVRVQVAMRFFYEGALYINELTGEQVHEGGIFVEQVAPRFDGLPPIELFVPLLP